MLNSLRRFGFAISTSMLIAGVSWSHTIRTVALTGEQAPGLPTGVIFHRFPYPTMNSAGQVAFTAEISGIGVNNGNDSGIWSEGSGPLTVVAREGTLAPGTHNGEVFDHFNYRFQLNAAGQLAFLTTLSGAAVDETNYQGIWAGTANSLRLIARNGEHAPGLSDDVHFVGLEHPQIGGSGNVAFSATAVGVGEEMETWYFPSGIWVGDANALSLVARAGEQAPGLPSGVAVYIQYSRDMVFGASEKFALRFEVTGPGIDETNREGIWLGDKYGLQPLVQSGQPAPGIPETDFGFFSPHKMNEKGDLVFQSYVVGNGVDATNQWGLWLEESGAIDLIAREGDLAPGTSADTKFEGYLGADVDLNSQGKVAFRASLTGPAVSQSNNRGVWSKSTDGLDLVVQSGTVPPGMSGDTRFYDFEQITMNSAGQTAFVGFLDGLGGPPSDRRGIWAEDRYGTLQPIARIYQQIEVRPGDVRTIRSISLAGFSDLGEIAFLALFLDGSRGIFISDLVAVPEPTSLLLIATSLCIIRHRFRAGTNTELP